MTAPADLVPVRAAGITSHRVRGVGVHEHHVHVVTGTGARVEVARWPGKPWRPAHVRTFDRSGAVVAEEAHSGVLSVGGLLRGAGYRLVDD